MYNILIISPDTGLNTETEVIAAASSGFLPNIPSVGTWTSRISPFWITSWAKCLRMSMCLAHSRPQMTLLPHSMHTVLSS